MGNKFIVRQPIRDAEDEIVGFDLVYHGENQAFSSEGDTAKQFASADMICSVLNKTSLRSLQGATNFITLNSVLLMKKLPKLFKASNLVIQLDDSAVIHPLSMHFVEQYAKQGYQIAVNDFEFSPRYMKLMDILNYIKIDVQSVEEPELKNLIDAAHGMGKKCIVSHIENHKQYSRAAMLRADYFEGPYVTTRSRLQAHDRKFLRTNFFKLFAEISKEVPDIRLVEKLIASDSALSYGLMKLANSDFFALRNHPTTVHQALGALGFGQLKQWVFMLAMDPSHESENRGLEEFIQLSFMRAHFYRELMRFADDIPLSNSEGYLMGMFSGLNQLISIPMEDILSELSVPTVFKTALVFEEGSCGTLLKLMKAYELGSWETVSAYAAELDITGENMIQAYFTCIEEVAAMWEKLNTCYSD